jgi:hypothetical protein
MFRNVEIPAVSRAALTKYFLHLGRLRELSLRHMPLQAKRRSETGSRKRIPEAMYIPVGSPANIAWRLANFVMKALTFEAG